MDDAAIVEFLQVHVGPLEDAGVVVLLTQGYFAAQVVADKWSDPRQQVAR